MKKKTGISCLIIAAIVIIGGVSIEMIHQKDIKGDRTSIDNAIKQNNEILQTTAFREGKENLLNIDLKNATTEQQKEVEEIERKGNEERQAYSNMVKEEKQKEIEAQKKEAELQKKKQTEKKDDWSNKSLQSISYLNYLGPIETTDYSSISKGKLVELCDKGVLNIDNEYMQGIHRYNSDNAKRCIDGLKKEYEILEKENTWLEPIVNYVSPKERVDAFNTTQKEYENIQDGLKKKLSNNYDEAEYNTYYKLWTNAMEREQDIVEYYLGVVYNGNTLSPII